MALMTEWAQLAWQFVSGVGLIALAFKTRQDDQAARTATDPDSAAWQQPDAGSR
ncbi:MAG: hypothetical protein ABI682_16190 [Acidobacteriota bacterium]